MCKREASLKLKLLINHRSSSGGSQGEATRRVVPGLGGNLPDYPQAGLVPAVFLHWTAARKPNDQLVQNQGPMGNGGRPFFGNPLVGQVQQLPHRAGRRKGGLVFGHFPELPIVPLDPIRGINQPPNFGRIIKIGGQGRPVVFPRTDCDRIFGAPNFIQFQQVAFRLVPGRGLLHLLQKD